ncbi:MAG TPA: hypothetical protein DHW82_07305 [Spirochaetia bacterium]|nr:MAG: hypothetical protein A2Y41_00560 [Spirochaetes bacterium GWB1_36_13]HCL56799.1 hypothetical protein [Spirochaetia bacterium]
MGIRDIIDKIKEEGEREVAKIKEHYEKRISEITKHQEEERKSFYDFELEKIAKEVEEVKRGILLSAKLEKRKKILLAKRELIAQVLDKVKKDLKELLGKDVYYQFLKSNLVKLGADGDTVYLSKSDMAEFSKELLKDSGKKLEFKEGRLDSGIIIEKKSFNYNISTESLIAQKAQDLEKLIGTELNVL